MVLIELHQGVSERISDHHSDFKPSNYNCLFSRCNSTIVEIVEHTKRRYALLNSDSV
jgi:hypothetical protein